MKKIARWILLLGSAGVFGQSPGPEGHFTFGFLATAEFQTLNIATPAPRSGGPYLVAGNRTGFGAGLGIWGRWPLLPALSLRPALAFSRTGNTLAFQTPDGQLVRDRYVFSDIELPVHFLLTNHFSRLPLRAVVIFGGRLSWNVAPARSTTAINLLPERLGLDIGLGAGIPWGKVLIQPEVIYSYGMTNSHDFRDTDYDWAVGRIVRDRLSVRVVVGGIGN
ncbi:MAG: hypothetical protein IPM98_00455 [Lewinellaceae bacterium]|nr:hypothetical protein [Lewinellaceae bacterium]